MNVRTYLNKTTVRRGCCRGSSIILFERELVVSYLLPIVTIALSLTIRHRISATLNSTLVGHFWPKFWDVLFGVNP